MSLDPFDILGLDVGYDIDDAALHRKFIEMSALHHPDRYTDPLEQVEAAEQAAAINEAYQVLSNPERRANTLLERFGGASKSDDKSLPPDLLMQMMEIREEQEEAQAANDTAKLEELADWARTQREEHLTRIAGHFRGIDPTVKPDEEVLKAIRLELNALRYFERMLEQID